jgi:hypothetical protein
MSQNPFRMRTHHSKIHPSLDRRGESSLGHFGRLSMTPQNVSSPCPQ